MHAECTMLAHDCKGAAASMGSGTSSVEAAVFNPGQKPKIHEDLHKGCSLFMSDRLLENMQGHSVGKPLWLSTSQCTAQLVEEGPALSDG